jgi:hypothetical protein
LEKGLGKTVAATSGTDVIAVLAAVIAASAAVLVGAFGLKHAFNYHVENSSLGVRLLGIRIQTLPVSDIERIEIVPFASLIPFSSRFRRDLFVSHKWCGYSNRLVAVKLRSGVIKQAILSPTDPEGLADSLKRAAMN